MFPLAAFTLFFVKTLGKQFWKPVQNNPCHYWEDQPQRTDVFQFRHWTVYTQITHKRWVRRVSIKLLWIRPPSVLQARKEVLFTAFWVLPENPRASNAINLKEIPYDWVIQRTQVAEGSHTILFQDWQSVLWLKRHTFETFLFHKRYWSLLKCSIKTILKTKMSHLLRNAKKVTAQDLSHLDANMTVAVIKFMFLFTTCSFSCFNNFKKTSCLLYSIAVKYNYLWI